MLKLSKCEVNLHFVVLSICLNCKFNSTEVILNVYMSLQLTFKEFFIEEFNKKY